MAPKRFNPVVYLLKPARDGMRAFSDVRLPNGTVIRQVDRRIHLAALARAARIFRKRLET